MRIATIFAAAAALAGLSGHALADGINYGSSYKDAPVVETVNWNGFYIGAGVGGGAVVHDLGVDIDKKGGGGSILDFDGIGGEGAFGTLQIGYDRLIHSRFLLGVFFDYDFSAIETEIKVLGTKLDVEQDHVWTAGLRAGFLVNPHTLVYALIGYSETEFDSKLNKIGIKIDDFTGYTVGGGLETNLHGNWFLKGEYRFTQFEDEKLFDAGFDADLEPSLHTARVVLSYKFNLFRDHHEPLK